ncbi:MAG: hypothetical protein ABL891_05340 [Burkholderiales bacterium]
MMRLLPVGAACVLACMANITVAADNMGRLFFEPAQRAQLDAARKQRDRRSLVTSDAEAIAAPQGPDVLTYNGVVRRSDGKSTVWINGKPMTERTRDSDVSVLGMRRDGAVSVTVPQAERPASLRVGQSVDVISGTIEESYARRATLYRPPTADPAVTPAKPPATAPTPAAQRAVRRDTKEADPDSGAAPSVERGARSAK